jgi:putative DNA primase/helicase
MFTSAALKEAGGNYDFKRVLDASDSAGWISAYGVDGNRSKTTDVVGSKKRLYWILPSEM